MAKIFCLHLMLLISALHALVISGHRLFMTWRRFLDSIMRTVLRYSATTFTFCDSGGIVRPYRLNISFTLTGDAPQHSHVMIRCALIVSCNASNSAISFCNSADSIGAPSGYVGGSKFLRIALIRGVFLIIIGACIDSALVPSPINNGGLTVSCITSVLVPSPINMGDSIVSCSTFTRVLSFVDNGDLIVSRIPSPLSPSSTNKDNLIAFCTAAVFNRSSPWSTQSSSSP